MQPAHKIKYGIEFASELYIPLSSPSQKQIIQLWNVSASLTYSK
jgi:hypothetical protein